MIRPRVLTVAGIDPCGGAGLGADARAIHVCGGMPATVPTCTTVQSRRGFVRASAVPPGELRAMLDAVLEDGTVAAMKVGLCADAATVSAIAEWHRALGASAPPLVVDPVLSATAGGGPAAAVEIARAIVRELAPCSRVLTPNLAEFEALGGVTTLLAGGAFAVLVTGGHGSGPQVIDRLVCADRTVEIVHPRLDIGPVHGTGCGLSAALATYLALDADLESAVRSASGRVHDWLRATRPSTDGLPVPLAIG